MATSQVAVYLHRFILISNYCRIKLRYVDKSAFLNFLMDVSYQKLKLATGIIIYFFNGIWIELSKLSFTNCRTWYTYIHLIITANCKHIDNYRLNLLSLDHLWDHSSDWLNTNENSLKANLLSFCFASLHYPKNYF